MGLKESKTRPLARRRFCPMVPASDNTAVGVAALLNNTEGSFNTAIGRQALANNTTGISNTANGFNALYSNTEGNFNGYR